MGARARGPSRDGQSFLLSSSARAGVLFVKAKKFFFRFASEFKPFSRHGPPALSSAREAAGVALQRRRERQVRPGEKKQGERERNRKRREGRRAHRKPPRSDRNPPPCARAAAAAAAAANSGGAPSHARPLSVSHPAKRNSKLGSSATRSSGRPTRATTTTTTETTTKRAQLPEKPPLLASPSPMPRSSTPRWSPTCGRCGWLPSRPRPRRRGAGRGRGRGTRSWWWRSRGGRT